MKKLQQRYFPTLPQGLPDNVLLVLQRGFGDVAKNEVVGVILTLCIRHGQWQPLTTKEVYNAIGSHPHTLNQQAMYRALHLLVEEGYLLKETYHEVPYIVPTAYMAHQALNPA